MISKVLFIEFSFLNGWRSIQDKINNHMLKSEDIEVIDFKFHDYFNFYPWIDEKFWEDARAKLAIKEAIGLAKQIGIVYIHFGTGFPRGKFAEVVRQFKEAEVKVVVESESMIGLENADWVFAASLHDMFELAEKINKWHQEKNRS